VKPTERVDERDTMFARMARRPGTPAYEDYYSERPERKAVDDRLRRLPDLCQPGGLHYDPGIARETVDYFERIARIRPDPAVVEEWAARIGGARDSTAEIKGMFLDLGAVAVGCAPLEREFVYTVKGRFDADYGREIDLAHPSAVVFLVEMDHDAMHRAPEAPTLRESARQYWRAAEISLTVEAALQALGHEAKAHYDAHYDVILPPLAVRAGLGELGRHNILIADRYGSRVRIGAVTTDHPVVHDAPVSLGAARFCEVCLKCAENCPSRALSTGEREVVRGVGKWPTDVERCYGYWRNAGTDCGICMAVCPYSHRNNWFHNMVRWTVRRFPRIARTAVWFDDVVYGRKWRRGTW
jgi:reductive dehalogenase